MYVAQQGMIAAETPPEWQPLIPLDMPALPSLKGGVLPGWAGKYAAALSDDTETPPELAIGMVLATVATASARLFRVMVHPGYFEPTNLWITVALSPGNRKSAVQSLASAPLLEWERSQKEAMQDEIKRITSQVKTSEARIKELRAKAAKETNAIKAHNYAKEVEQLEAELPEIPQTPQLWTSDATPERLGTIMADNNERMAWLSSEGGVFDLLSGRYSGGIPNLDLVLKAHSGDPERVDRGSRPPVFLRRPLLTIGLSPQPDVLRGLCNKPGFRGRGLLGRFLYLIPPSYLGFRKRIPKPIPNNIANAYRNGILAILNMPSAIDQDGNETTHLLKLSEDAHALWDAFGHKVEKWMRPDGDFEFATDWAGKAPGATARLAAVLHVIDFANDKPWVYEINAVTMEKAIQLMEVFSKHALYAFDLMDADSATTAARRVWQWIIEKKFSAFTIREAHQSLKGTFKHIKEILPALDVLIERGYILQTSSPSGSHPGRRPSPTLIVRPDIVEIWRL